MLRTLKIDPRVPAVHGVLIRRQAVDEQTRAYVTVKQARAHARSIIKNAHATATRLEHQALREGFQAGWTDSINGLFNALQDSERFYEKIERELKQSVQEELQNSAQQPELALYLIKDWLAAHATGSEKLSVILPKFSGSQVAAVLQCVQDKTGLTPVVSVGNTNNVVIQLNDQGYEFAPERMVGELNELASRCFQKLAVRKQCADWSKEITNDWLSELAQRHGEATTSAVDYEEELDKLFFGDFDDEFTEDLAS
jgi:vacuolar-type H+-ATPase subunit H